MIDTINTDQHPTKKQTKVFEQTFVSPQVVFKKPVSLKEYPKVNEWLTCVESEMRTTLATLLAEAVTDVQQFNSENIDGQQYMKWVDGFQVRRVLCRIHTYNKLSV